MDTPENMRQCEDCKKSFNSYQAWYYHRRMTHGGLPEKQRKTCGKRKCDDCEREFKNYHSWYSHRLLKHRRHAGVTCKHCDQKFVTCNLRNTHFYHAVQTPNPPDISGLLALVEASLPSEPNVEATPLLTTQ